MGLRRDMSNNVVGAQDTAGQRATYARLKTETASVVACPVSADPNAIAPTAIAFGSGSYDGAAVQNAQYALQDKNNPGNGKPGAKKPLRMMGPCTLLP